MQSSLSSSLCASVSLPGSHDVSILTHMSVANGQTRPSGKIKRNSYADFPTDSKAKAEKLFSIISIALVERIAFAAVHCVCCQQQTRNIYQRDTMSCVWWLMTAAISTHSRRLSLESIHVIFTYLQKNTHGSSFFKLVSHCHRLFFLLPTLHLVAFFLLSSLVVVGKQIARGSASTVKVFQRKNIRTFGSKKTKKHCESWAQICPPSLRLKPGRCWRKLDEESLFCFFFICYAKRSGST